MKELFFVFSGGEQPESKKLFATYEQATSLKEAKRLARFHDSTEEHGVVVRVWVDENGRPRVDFMRSVGGSDDR